MSGWLLSFQAAQRFADVLAEWRRVADQKPQPVRPARITVYTTSGRKTLTRKRPRTVSAAGGTTTHGGTREQHR